MAWQCLQIQCRRCGAEPGMMCEDLSLKGRKWSRRNHRPHELRIREYAEQKRYEKEVANG